MARRDMFRYRYPTIGDFFVIGEADDGRLLVYSVSNDSGGIKLYLILRGAKESISRPIESQIVGDDTIIEEFIAFKILMERDARRRSDSYQKAIMAACVKHIAPKMMPMDHITDVLVHSVIS